MPTKCPQCGAMTLYHNKGISKKTGKSYENYKCSSCGYIEWKKAEETNKTQDCAILMEEITDFRKEFNERFNALAKYLIKKLGK